MTVRRRRIVFYCQSSSGIGHLVRSAAIVRALARRHAVVFVVGGLRFPGSPAFGPWDTVELPPLARVDGRLIAPGGELAAVLAARAAALRALVERVQPDVLVVEHFPFSRWQHRDEIIGAIAAAGTAPVVASLRDIARRSRFDTWPDPPANETELDRRFGAEVLPALNGLFHLLLVHGDPRVTRLEEQIGWADRIAVPVRYTGYVATPAAPADASDADGAVVLSGGGGRETRALALPCIDAWRTLGDHRLVVFAGPLASGDVARELERRAAGLRVTVRRATGVGELASWMRRAQLSISRAGYNTCVDALAARARVLLVPSPIMADQRLRAARLAALGLARTLAPEDANPARLAQVIRDALAAPAPAPALDLDLDGAERSATLIGELA